MNNLERRRFYLSPESLYYIDTQATLMNVSSSILLDTILKTLAEKAKKESQNKGEFPPTL